MTRMQDRASLASPVAAVALVAAVGGAFGPQDPRAAAWYLSLRKPRGTPPGPAIGAIWLVLYGLLAVTGVRLMRARRSTARTTALSCWGAALCGVALFPFTFFGRRKLGESGAVSASMLAAASGTTIAAARVDRVAALCCVPVVLWVGAATVLSEELWRRNAR